MPHKHINEPDTTPLQIDGGPLTVVDVEQVARLGRPVALATSALERISQSRRFLEQTIGKGRPIYGVNTGFGSFSTTTIASSTTIPITSTSPNIVNWFSE